MEEAKLLQLPHLVATGGCQLGFTARVASTRVLRNELANPVIALTKGPKRSQVSEGEKFPLGMKDFTDWCAVIGHSRSVGGWIGQCGIVM